MNLTAWMRAHRSSVIAFVAMLAIGGLVAAAYLPVALFPNVAFPRLMVNVDAGDRPADRMTIEVTKPIEEAVRGVLGVRSIRSASTRGSADISINFDWGTDMIPAMLQVESAINQVIGQLPTGTTFRVQVMNPTVFPSLAYSLTSDKVSLVKLHDLAYYQLRPLLTTVVGVAKVNIQGGRESEYQVMLDPARMEAHGLTIADVSKELSAANVVTAVGRLEDHDKLYLAMVDTRFSAIDQIGDTILQKNAAGLVRVRDVGKVTTSTVPQWTRVTADGHDAVILGVYQQPDANTVQIAQDVRAKLAQFEKTMPVGVKIANWYDQSELIIASAGSVRDAVLIGIVLAGAVLFLFLRNGKITLIAMFCVPVVLAGTVLLLSVIHSSFNIMTLGGMAAAVGLIIDDAIVMVEHIVRRLRASSGSSLGKVWEAAAEFTQPLIASSLSTIVIFAPLAFLSGVTGAFFKALSLTMAASLVISFLVAWLAVPVLADRFLTEKDAHQEEGGKLTLATHRKYAQMMKRILARPALLLFGLIPLLILAWIGYKNVGSGFMPTMDEGGFILDYRADPGTSLTETDRLLQKVETILRDTPEVETYSRRTGLQLGGSDVTEANEGDFFVRLKNGDRRPIDEVMDDVRKRVQKNVAGLDIDMAQLMEDLIGDLTAVPQPIEVKLYSENGASLATAADSVVKALGKVNGAVEITNQIVLAGDALNIQVDRAKAGIEGMDPDEISSAMTDLLDGSLATNKVDQTPKLVGIRAWIPLKFRQTAEAVGDLRIKSTADGHYFPLRRVATISTDVGQPQIDHENLKRLASVTARITGRDLGSTIVDVQAELRKPGVIPPGVTYTLGGLYAEQRAAFGGLMAVFGAAVALVFLLLLFLYGRLAIALSMLVTTLLALSAVTVGLWITHTELNISSMMGMTMIVGIATEVAIFYVSELVSLPAGQNRHEALIEAGINRMRPIAMTTFAAILALMPLALGIGAGSAMQKPLAIAIISGLVLQLPLVLIVLPGLLSLIRPNKAGE